MHKLSICKLLSSWLDWVVLSQPCWFCDHTFQLTNARVLSVLHGNMKLLLLMVSFLGWSLCEIHTCSEEFVSILGLILNIFSKNKGGPYQSKFLCCFDECLVNFKKTFGNASINMSVMNSRLLVLRTTFPSSLQAIQRHVKIKTFKNQTHTYILPKKSHIFSFL